MAAQAEFERFGPSHRALAGKRSSSGLATVAAATVVSIAAHGLALAITRDLFREPEPRDVETPVLRFVEPPPTALATAAAEPAAAEPIAQPTPAPPTMLPPIERRARRQRPPPPEPPQAEPAREEPTGTEIVDFSGLTLARRGPGWNVPFGDGVARSGVVDPEGRRGRRRGTPTGTSEAAPAPMAAPTPTVAARDLSRSPRMPGNLDAVLQRHYPGHARRQGIEGRAVLALRIEPNGRPVVLRLMQATRPEFGEACRVTIREGGPWRPPLDRRGHPVATITRFTCNFEVAH